MKRCPIDNAAYEDGKEFCPFCGALLIDEKQFQKTVFEKPVKRCRIEYNSDGTYSLLIYGQSFRVTFEELDTLGAEIQMLLESHRSLP